MVTAMQLVPCDPKYWDFVRRLRIDSRVQGGFLQQNVFITRPQQHWYMTKHSRDYRVCLVNQTPAGYVGVLDDDIRVCTHPDFQKQGVARFMIKAIMKLYPHAVARIKVDNKASLALFASCGFTAELITMTQ